MMAVDAFGLVTAAILAGMALFLGCFWLAGKLNVNQQRLAPRGVVGLVALCLVALLHAFAQKHS